MNLREAKKLLGALSARQLVKLSAWISDLLEGTEQANVAPGAKGRQHRSHKTFRQEMIRCGKKGCKCVEGKLHGPYWYTYWSEGGKTKSQYIGKRLPKGVKSARELKSRDVR
jgi:hypothetical protein